MYKYVSPACHSTFLADVDLYMSRGEGFSMDDASLSLSSYSDDDSHSAETQYTSQIGDISAIPRTGNSSLRIWNTSLMIPSTDSMDVTMRPQDLSSADSLCAAIRGSIADFLGNDDVSMTTDKGPMTIRELDVTQGYQDYSINTLPATPQKLGEREACEGQESSPSSSSSYVSASPYSSSKWMLTDAYEEAKCSIHTQMPQMQPCSCRSLFITTHLWLPCHPRNHCAGSLLPRS